MKKVLLLSIVVAISFGAIAQHNDDHNNQKNKKSQHETKYNNDHNDEWRNENNRRNDNDEGQWQYQNNQRNNNRYDNRNSGNLPRRVRDAFNRDYPNAKCINWTSDRGIWSARFRRSGLFRGNSTVSYRANGQRVNNYIGQEQRRGTTSNNGYYTRNN
ncbi:MAG: hypothetical protein ACOYLO_09990 [Ferruginibacter sp.]